MPADDVFVDRGLALQLGDDAGGGIDVEQHEVRLAVALDLVGEVLEAPGFGLGDLALVASTISVAVAASASTCAWLRSWRARNTCS
jgi:hypothetical protein